MDGQWVVLNKTFPLQDSVQFCSKLRGTPVLGQVLGSWLWARYLCAENLLESLLGTALVWEVGLGRRVELWYCCSRDLSWPNTELRSLNSPSNMSWIEVRGLSLCISTLIQSLDVWLPQVSLLNLGVRQFPSPEELSCDSQRLLANISGLAARKMPVLVLSREVGGTPECPCRQVNECGERENSEVSQHQSAWWEFRKIDLYFYAIGLAKVTCLIT